MSAPESTASFNFLLYKGEYFDNQSSAATANLVTVTGSASTSNINFDLARGGGTIAGRVIGDGTGGPIANMPVHAMGPDDRIVSFDRTDGDGYYRITALPAGAYRVRTGGNPWENAVDEFYGDTPDPAAATLVDVAEDAHVTGIDFALARGGRIAGRVTADLGGDAVGSILVAVTGMTAPFLSKSTVTTYGDGLYELGGLPPGAYRVAFTSVDGFLPEYHQNRQLSEEADLVTVVAGEQTRVDAGLALGGRITGRVTNNITGGVIAQSLVTVSRIDVPGFSASTLTEVDGSYALAGLSAGTYRVGVPEIGQWYSGRTDSLSADAVDVVAGGTTAQIDFSGTPLSWGCDADPGSRLSLGGSVMFAGQPVATFGTRVELYAATDSLPGQPPARTFIAALRPDPGGHYQFYCLDEGTYYLRCVPGGTDYLGQWYPNADSSHAIGLPLSAGHSLDNVDFSLQKGGRILGGVTSQGTALQGFPVYARNVATGELYSVFTGPTGQYILGGGASGGMASGSYLVWTESRNTANHLLLPVTLARFEAVPAAGGIAVEWRTMEEHDHVGFHVYRAESSSGAAARLTDRLITAGPEYRFLDETAAAERNYWYWLGAVDRQGREERLGPVTASSGTPAVSQLLGVFPNPLQAQSVVHFSVAAPVRARVQIFDVAGRLVRTLADRDYPAGRASVTWDGLGENGVATRAGVYFVRFSAGAARGTVKLLVAR